MKHLKPEIKLKIVEEFNSGMKIEELSAKYGVSNASIMNWIKIENEIKKREFDVKHDKFLYLSPKEQQSRLFETIEQQAITINKMAKFIIDLQTEIKKDKV